MTDEQRARIVAELAAADDQLDTAWLAGEGLDAALARAKRLSAALGRAPEIEDAKLALARERGTTPSEAYAQLVEISQRANRKLRDAARDIVASG